MLLAPCKEGYEDFETKLDYYALHEAINCNDDEFAKELFAKYALLPPFESDNYTYFNTDKDYVLDADADGVYMFTRVSATARIKQMTLQDCIEFWNDNAVDKYCSCIQIHKMSDLKWWDRLTSEIGGWDFAHVVLNSLDTFNDTDMYFAYVEDPARLVSFSTKQELMEMFEEWFIETINKE